jgi:hypothetical protein
MKAALRSSVGPEMQRMPDICHAAMAEPVEVLNQLRHAFAIVETHGCHIPALEHIVEGGNRYCGVNKLLDLGWNLLRHDHRETGYAAPQNQLEAVREPLGIVVRVCDQDLISKCECIVLQRMEDIHKKWILKIRDNYAQRLAASGHQRSSLKIRRIMHLLQSGHHSLPGGRLH